MRKTFILTVNIDIDSRYTQHLCFVIYFSVFYLENIFDCDNNCKLSKCGGLNNCSEEWTTKFHNCEKNLKLNNCNNMNHTPMCLLAYDYLRYPTISHEKLEKELFYCNRTGCRIGEYLCKYHKYCIKIDQICDGFNDCLLADDEYNCGSRNKQPTSCLKCFIFRFF